MTLTPLRALVEKWRKEAAKEQRVSFCADELAALLDTMEGAGELDNHHNALTCPYCNPNSLVLTQPAPPSLTEADLRVATCCYCYGPLNFSDERDWKWIDANHTGATHEDCWHKEHP